MAGPAAESTVGDLIATPSPIMATKPGLRPNPTTNKEYVKISFDHVQKLEGSNFDNLKSMFGDLWNKPALVTAKEFDKIEDESAFEYPDLKREVELSDAAKKWISLITTPSIVHNAAELLERFDAKPEDIALKPYQSMKQRRNTAGVETTPKGKKLGVGTFKPDWLMFDQERRKNGESDHVHVVGEDKLSANFDPALLVYLEDIGGIDNSSGPEDRKDPPKANLSAAVWALKQVGTYAFLGNTRYAFIRTETTTTYLRYFLVQSSEWSIDAVLGVQYAWVRNTSYGPDELTSDMGLVALGWMSLNKDYVELVEEEKLEDLSVWYAFNDRSGKLYYFHPLTERLTDAKPPLGCTLLDPEFQNCRITLRMINQGARAGMRWICIPY
ncbi:hypothetical protein GGR57DRAFT_519838 [Xylariaceae sp. FL1272]|nr:hypothetical protein GGR57DRAFT_519838 [Xylariaceae sp. FL1272]